MTYERVDGNVRKSTWMGIDLVKVKHVARFNVFPRASDNDNLMKTPHGNNALNNYLIFQM